MGKSTMADGQDEASIAERRFRIGYLQGISATISAIADRFKHEEREALTSWQGKVLAEWVNGNLEPTLPRPTFPGGSGRRPEP